MSPDEAARLRRAKDLVDRAYADPLDVDVLARHVHVSPAHFSRRFKAAFGETPHQLVTRRRLEHAQHLLHTGRSVTDVCFDVGFESLGSFSGLFKARVGVSPTAYRATFLKAA